MNLWWVFIKFPRNSLYETMILHGISMNSNKLFRRLTGWFTQMSCPNPWKTKLFEHKQFQYQCPLCLCVVGWNAIYCVPVRVGWWLLVFYIQTRSVNRYRFSLSTHLSHIFVFISHLYTKLFVSNCYRVDLMSNCTSNIQNNSRISYNFLSCTGFRLGNDFFCWSWLLYLLLAITDSLFYILYIHCYNTMLAVIAGALAYELRVSIQRIFTTFCDLNFLFGKFICFCCCCKEKIEIQTYCNMNERSLNVYIK